MKKKGAIINLIFALIWLTFAGLLTWYAISVLNAKTAVAIICVVVAIVFYYFLALFLHELGHLIFAKKAGLKVNKVNFGFFTVFFEKDKKRVKFFTFFGEEAGESQFLPPRNLTKEKLCSVAFGGLLFSLIFALLSLIAILVIANGVAFCLIGASCVPATYILVINLLTFDKTSDGALIFSSGDYCDVLVAILEHDRQVALGIIPSCPVIFEKSKQPLAKIYYYKHLVLREKFERAKDVLIDLSKDFSHFTSEEFQLIFPEIVYFECLTKKISESMQESCESYFTGEINTVATIRAHSEYRRFKGENNWSETLSRTYERLLKSESKFQKEYEKKIKQFGGGIK